MTKTTAQELKEAESLFANQKAIMRALVCAWLNLPHINPAGYERSHRLRTDVQHYLSWGRDYLIMAMDHQSRIYSSLERRVAYLYGRLYAEEMGEGKPPPPSSVPASLD